MQININTYTDKWPETGIMNEAIFLKSVSYGVCL